MEPFINEFLEYLEVERGRSKKTTENYRRYLLRLLKFRKLRSARDITDRLVREYRIWLNREGNLSRRTQSYHVIALRAFLKYCAKRDLGAMAPEKIELPKLPSRDIDIPSADDIDRLLVSPKGNAVRALRDRAILELLFSTGLRVGELASLTKDMVDVSRGEFSVRGKGGKIRVVFLSDGAKKALAGYLHARNDIEPALIVGTQKVPRPLSARQVERLVAKYAIASGISRKVTPHTLRHAFATDLLLNGADLRSVQSLLGHSSITTTQVYTHLTDKQLREVHQAFHGRRRGRGR